MQIRLKMLCCGTINKLVKNLKKILQTDNDLIDFTIIFALLRRIQLDNILFAVNDIIPVLYGCTLI